MTGDKSELELELVRMTEAKQRIEAKVAASRTRTDDLELSRRASDAKATSHMDRAKRLHEEAEVKKWSYSHDVHDVYEIYYPRMLAKGVFSYANYTNRARRSPRLRQRSSQRAI